MSSNVLIGSNAKQGYVARVDNRRFPYLELPYIVVCLVHILLLAWTLRHLIL